MTPRLGRSLAVAAVAALLVAGCTPDKTQISPEDGGEAQPGPSQSDGGAPGDPNASAVYDQDVDWSSCGEDLECATIQVPLDWSEPDGETIDLAINRAPAQDPDARIGSLLINPGGPGGSGLDFTESFVVSAGEDLLDAYDVVGFDPRGVGESTPVMCGSDEEVDAYYIPDRPIRSQADVDEWNELNASFAALCQADSGAVAANVDTVSVARDMDVIRAVLGDEKLQYLGFSYGTQLGATYAEIYPENVGRLVLDGAVDFLLPEEEIGAGQAEGFENALTNFLRWCTSRDECALGDDVDEARDAIQDLLAQALADPLPTGTKWDLNGNLMVYGIVVTLYDEASWQYLDLGLDEAVNSGTGSVLYQLANFYLDRDGDSGEYLANSTWAFTAINCLDALPDEPWTFEDIEEYRALMEEASPTFGWWFASSTGCDNWPWTADEHIESLEAAATAEQMLVIGTTNDPATPYAWSVSLAERLGAEVLTYDGEGHTAYGRSNQCIVDAVDGFLVDGEMPDSGTEC
ncbi:alpha/beta hydrolase [Demequina activiva]|uniref:Alpha/beta hydrolase n=1 Tax=Demequina activiva TaxID=1582364 RepID=A0A919Q009_9MICO|nr:alpha/beta hydrolase [Demequina activiva]GIG53805.1 alpha/beta hydrolase [Demequina activiva]